jgi:cytochrome P450
MEQHELLGDTYKVNFPGPKMNLIVTCNLENIEHVLRKNFKVWDKGQLFHDNISQLLGETGIFCNGMSSFNLNIDGNAWKSQRKIASNIFTIANFKSLFTKTFDDHSVVLVNYLKNAAESGDVVDLAKVMFAFTLDSFGRYLLLITN